MNAAEHTDGLRLEAALAELALINLSEHSLESVMTTIAELAKQVVRGAAEVSVTLVEGERATTIARTGELALSLDQHQYVTGHGPCLDALAGGTTIVIEDAATETRWPEYLPRARELGLASSLCLPVPLQREVIAALNIYGTQSCAFSAPSVTAAETFASYAGVALANMHVHSEQARVAEQLQAAMQSRAVIEQAKGILMAERRCTPDEAFNILIELSQHSNRRLRDIAAAMVEAISRPTP